MSRARHSCILLARFCAIMASMGITLIVLFVVVAVILAASIVLGRDAREVESARDTEYLELEGVWIRSDVVGRLVVISAPADEDQIDLPTMLWLVTVPVVGPIFYALGRVARPVRRLWMRPFVADSDDLTEEMVDDAGRSTPAAVSKT